MSIKVLFAGIAEAELHAALARYERFLGRSPDTVVKADKVMWRIWTGPSQRSDTEDRRALPLSSAREPAERHQSPIRKATGSLSSR